MADPGDKDADTSGMSTEGKMSKEALSVIAMLEECGVTEYDPRVVSMLLDVQYSVTSKILEMASGLSRHAEKSRIDSTDVQTAADMIGLLGQSAPDRGKMLLLAQEKNAQPLPAIRHNFGLKLPNDRFCQLQQNVMYRTDEEYHSADQQSQQHQRVHPAHIIEPPSAVYRTEQVQNMLKRRAPEDDFDS